MQIWRVVFGISVMYFLFMVFLAFLNMEQVRMVLEWLDPTVKDAKREVDMVEVGGGEPVAAGSFK